MLVAHNQNLQHYIWVERPCGYFLTCRSVAEQGGETEKESGVNGKSTKQESAAGQWDVKHKRINLLSYRRRG